MEAVSGSKVAIRGVPAGADWCAGLKDTTCPTMAGIIRVGMAQWRMTLQNKGVWKKAHCGEGTEDKLPFNDRGS